MPQTRLPAASESEQSPDFLLFEDPYASYRVSPPYSHHHPFHPVVSDVSFPPILGDSDGMHHSNHHHHHHQHHHQHHHSLYPLGTSAMDDSPLPLVASSAPDFDAHPAFMPFHAADSDIPRAYVDDQLGSAPDVLVHPPALAYHSSQLSDRGEYRTTPSASPATSVGGRSGLSGSEAGSARTSPYSRPTGVEDPLQNFAMIDPQFSGTTVAPFRHAQLGLTLRPGIDPSLVSNSPPEQQPLSASPFGSPPWNVMHSPPPPQPQPQPQQAASSPSPPDMHRHAGQAAADGSGRLSPSAPHLFGARHAPYQQRRPSAGSEHSRHSMGSPGTYAVEATDAYEAVGYAPAQSPSQRSTGSAGRLARSGSSSDSIHSNGAHAGAVALAAAAAAAAAPSSKDAGHGSVGSIGSNANATATASAAANANAKETVCSECHKSFRDLRAHQLTHQLERPEKCPIATCEYSKKGFARKYDCQRHTLTHYKGTMVCGFCPGSGSAMEKSFNRADVFKRHLMAVHSVEQTPPNSRQKKTGKKGLPADFGGSYSSGKCSTCSITFATAQQFYEHLDDCVLSKVVEEEPAARANERNLAQVKLEDMDDVFAVAAGRMDESGQADDDDVDEELGDVDELEEDDEEKDETYTGTTAAARRPKGGRTPGTRSKTKRAGVGSSR